MRRFADGAIHEAVAWDTVAPDLQGSIPELIVTHILERHFPRCKVCFFALRWRLIPLRPRQTIE
jgi:hypothetical protein